MGIVIFLGVTIWALGMIIAPLTLPPNSINDLTPDEDDRADGRYGVGTADHSDITKDMNPYAKHYYEAGDFNCHTFSERSFFINGNQMPFCARDVGIFFGMAIGLGLALFIRFELKLWWLFGGLAPMGVDWLLNSYFDVYHSNLTRLGTGGLAGTVITLALGFVIYDMSKDAEIKKRFTESPPEELDEIGPRPLDENQGPIEYEGPSEPAEPDLEEVEKVQPQEDEK